MTEEEIKEWLWQESHFWDQGKTEGIGLEYFVKPFKTEPEIVVEHGASSSMSAEREMR